MDNFAPYKSKTSLEENWESHITYIAELVLKVPSVLQMAGVLGRGEDVKLLPN